MRSKIIIGLIFFGLITISTALGRMHIEKAEGKDMTIQDVIDGILKEVQETPIKGTVDTFKTGDPTREVTGIVTTFLASYEVIQKAVELGANLIITHEPTFNHHLDEVDWL